VRIWIAAILAAGVLAGCTRSGAHVADTTTLVIAQQREPHSLNPALENGVASRQWGLLLFQYLVKYGDDGRLIGDAATQVPTTANGGISRDGLTIVYHLRKHLRFADGTPLTARDCVWSIRAVVNPANNMQSRYGYDRIARAEAPRDDTLVLHLLRPFAPLVTLVLAPLGYPILPAHLLAQYPNFNDIPFGSQPIGSGPYVVTNWRRGDSVDMRANPYYWQGKPRIDRLVVRFVPDANTAINLMTTHEVDGFYNDEDYGSYPALKTVPGIRVVDAPQNAVGSIVFNTQDPITGDPRVRHAIAESVDIASLVTKAYRGALSSAAAGRGLFIWAYDAHAYPDVPYDPQGARTLLDAAGWKLGTDGVRYKDGRPLEVLLIIAAQTPGDAVAANVIADYANKVGVRVTLKAFNEDLFVAPADLGGPVYGGKFELALYSFVNGDDPDTTDQFACDRVPPKGYNKSRFCDPSVDALLAAGVQTNAIGLRKAIYAHLQTKLYGALPIALLYQRREVDAFTDRLQGQTTSLSGAFWNAGAWWLSK
jgi:peptide/nickel transport system substrate-binding protein